MKTCATCKWCKADARDSILSECHAPENRIDVSDDQAVMDLVGFGGIAKTDILEIRCVVHRDKRARRPYPLCGPAGKWWEPKG